MGSCQSLQEFQPVNPKKNQPQDAEEEHDSSLRPTDRRRKWKIWKRKRRRNTRLASQQVGRYDSRFFYDSRAMMSHATSDRPSSRWSWSTTASEEEKTVTSASVYFDKSERLVQCKPPPRQQSGGLIQPFYYQPHSHYAFPRPQNSLLPTIRRDSHSSSSTGSSFWGNASRDLADHADIEPSEQQGFTSSTNVGCELDGNPSETSRARRHSSSGLEQPTFNQRHSQYSHPQPKMEDDDNVNIETTTQVPNPSPDVPCELDGNPSEATEQVPNPSPDVQCELDGNSSETPRARRHSSGGLVQPRPQNSLLLSRHDSHSSSSTGSWFFDSASRDLAADDDEDMERNQMPSHSRDAPCGSIASSSPYAVGVRVSMSQPESNDSISRQSSKSSTGSWYWNSSYKDVLHMLEEPSARWKQKSSESSTQSLSNSSSNSSMSQYQWSVM